MVYETQRENKTRKKEGKWRNNMYFTWLALQIKKEKKVILNDISVYDGHLQDLQ